MLRKLYKTVFFIPIILTLSAAYFLRHSTEDAKCRKFEYNLKTLNSEETNFEFNVNLKKDEHLLLGNLYTTHTVYDSANNLIESNVSTRSRLTDTWPHYFTYKATSEGIYKVLVFRPRKLTNRVIAGMEPRVCAGSEINRLPLIMPSTTAISNIIALAISAFLISLVCLVGGLKRTKGVYALHAFYFFILFLASLKANHNYDTFIFRGANGQTVLQTIVGLLTSYPLTVALTSKLKSRNIFLILTVHVLCCITLPLFKITVFGYSAYLLYVSMSILLCSLYFLRKGRPWLALSLIFFPLDITPAFGLQLKDFPIVSSWFVSISTFYCLDLWSRGAEASFIVLKRQLLRVRQYEQFNDLKNFIDINSIGLIGNNRDQITILLKLVSEAFSCRNATFSIKAGTSFVTYRYDNNTTLLQEFDQDEGIGVVLNRVLLFNDSFPLNNIQNLKVSLDKRFLEKIEYNSFKYFSCLPIFSHGEVIGAIALTSFKDEDIFSKGFYITETAAQAQSLVDFFTSKVTSNSLRLNENQGELLKDLKSILFLCAETSRNLNEFFEEFIGQVFSKYKLESVLFFKKGNYGVPEVFRVKEDGTRKALISNNLVLTSDGSNQSGPTVVALLEGKSSFLSNSQEMRQVLHPKTVEYLAMANISGFGSYPLGLGGETAAWMLLVPSELPDFFKVHLHSVICDLLETFVSMASFVGSQEKNRSLNLVTSRLVSDVELRELIVAKSDAGKMPATSGLEETGLIINIDLISSKNVDVDLAGRAAVLGEFFDFTMLKLKQIFESVTICKSTGDGLILRVPIRKDIEFPVVDLVISVMTEIDSYAKDLNTTGVRACIHYGDYFVGVVGTSSFGQIDAIGHNIDRVFRMEQFIKIIPELKSQSLLAVSNEAIELLSAQKTNWTTHQWSSKTGSSFILALEPSVKVKKAA